jgi:hypothetical protein
MPVDVRTIRGVELVKVGTWECVNGTWTVTVDMLRSAVDAHMAGVVRKPVIKLGHEGPMRDGAPALGFVDALRMSADGQTLLSDLVNVPAAVANLLPHAYPDRSIEAWMDYEAPDGTVWPFLITGLALLGATGPGCETLASLQDVASVQDVANLYGLDVAAAQRAHPVSTPPAHSTILPGRHGPALCKSRPPAAVEATVSS